MIAVAVALGPVTCSWFCPWGLVSEGIDRLRARGAPWPARGGRATRRLRVVALASLLGLSALAGTPLAALLAPPRLIAALPLEAWRGAVVPWLTGALLLALLALELVAPRRLVCRALCPAGAAAALLRRSFTWGPRFDAAACRCPDPAACRRVCAWGIDPRELAPRDGCTSCMACVERCPTGALAAPRRHSPHRRN
jgi:ferredoxin-type protein NapH